MKFNVFKRDTTKATGRFSEFFRVASFDKKKQVFTEAAERANKDQQKVLQKSELKYSSR